MADKPTPEHEESAVARWSRRKQDSQAEAPAPNEPDSSGPPAKADDKAEKTDQAEVVAALPPIDSLTAESDFTPFLDRAVPAELRRLALRKLWRSDPVLANLDGLNDYDDDFRTMGVGKLVRTAYQVGKGIVSEAEKASDKIAPAAPADEQPASDRETETADASRDDGEDHTAET